MAKQSWLNDTNEKSLLDEYVAQLESFTDAFADGRITDRELDQQEQRLIQLLKDVEPQLSDELHVQVTRLLCELSAYNIMQTFYNLQPAQRSGAFQG